jgi:hypothetical protein
MINQQWKTAPIVMRSGISSKTRLPTGVLLKNGLLRLLAGLIGVLICPFSFEGPNEALHGGVIVAIALAAHTDLDASLSQQHLVTGTGVLTSSVRVMQQARLRMSTGQSHLQGLLDQLGVSMGSHRPADNPA